MTVIPPIIERTALLDGVTPEVDSGRRVAEDALDPNNDDEEPDAPVPLAPAPVVVVVLREMGVANTFVAEGLAEGVEDTRDDDDDPDNPDEAALGVTDKLGRAADVGRALKGTRPGVCPGAPLEVRCDMGCSGHVTERLHQRCR